mmetsp:Transcript_45850/g.97966  ORF Transcript_45850/g.97966 Transcript_45850/m.97966 type:complete len:231 (+) Transcript_45850:280-972(+)
MKRCKSFFSLASSTKGLSVASSCLLSSETSPSESEGSISPVAVSGVSSGPTSPFSCSPRFTHFAMSASRRARLSASFCLTSASSSSAWSKPTMAPSSPSASPFPLSTSSSSRQVPRRTRGASSNSEERKRPRTASSIAAASCPLAARMRACDVVGFTSSRLLERPERFRALSSSTSLWFLSFFSFLPLDRLSLSFSRGTLRLLDAWRRLGSTYPEGIAIHSCSPSSSSCS